MSGNFLLLRFFLPRFRKSNFKLYNEGLNGTRFKGVVKRKSSREHLSQYDEGQNCKLYNLKLYFTQQWSQHVTEIKLMCRRP